MDKQSILEMIKDREAQLDIEKPILTAADQALMQNMIREINEAVGGRLRGYSDLVDQYIHGAGEIVAKYIFRFEDQGTRASLLLHLVGNKTYSVKPVQDAAEIVWQLYTAYRNSEEFAVWTIRMEYYDAFARLRAKKMADRLIESVRNPLEFNALPRTVKMLAALKKPELEAILLDALADPEKMEKYLRIPAVREQFRFDQHQVEKECRRWSTTSVLKAVVGIQYYPSEMALRLLRESDARKQEEMQKKLLTCKTRTEKYDVKYDYDHIQKVVLKSIGQIEKAFSRR